MFDHIAHLTDINDHTSAYIAGCRKLAEFDVHLESHIKKLIRIRDESDELGYLPHHLGEQRRKLYKGMIEGARQAMTPDLFEEFHSSF